MLLNIVQYPSPILREKSQPVASVNAEIRQLISAMFETMYAANGVGLAAPQVGILQRIVVIDVGRLENEETKPDPIAIINPQFISQEGKLTWEEGCLSLPQLTVPVERSAQVVIKALDQHGQERTLLGEELLAVAFQHEIDHLEGILLVDRLSRLKRDLYKQKLARQEPLPESKPSSRKAYVG